MDNHAVQTKGVILIGFHENLVLNLHTTTTTQCVLVKIFNYLELIFYTVVMMKVLLDSLTNGQTNSWLSQLFSI